MRTIPFKFTVLVFAVLLAGCSSSGGRFPAVANGYQPPAFSAQVADENVLAKWSRSCALCHITGEAGAPVVGDTAEWQRRLQQGEETVLNNVLNGFNSMPPLGYCMACEVSDFRAMIAYMAGLDQ
jgi:cytochrome c5